MLYPIGLPYVVYGLIHPTYIRFTGEEAEDPRVYMMGL